MMKPERLLWLSLLISCVGLVATCQDPQERAQLSDGAETARETCEKAADEASEAYDSLSFHSMDFYAALLDVENRWTSDPWDDFWIDLAMLDPDFVVSAWAALDAAFGAQAEEDAAIASVWVDYCRGSSIAAEAEVFYWQATAETELDDAEAGFDLAEQRWRTATVWFNEATRAAVAAEDEADQAWQTFRNDWQLPIQVLYDGWGTGY